MSIFAKNLKTIKTDITGTELQLRINVAVWLILDKEYGIPQGEWTKAYEENRIVTMAKFLAAVLKANKYEVSLEEVMENVSQYELDAFIEAYNDMVLDEYEKDLVLNTEDKEETEVVEGK